MAGVEGSGLFEVDVHLGVSFVGVVYIVLVHVNLASVGARGICDEEKLVLRSHSHSSDVLQALHNGVGFDACFFVSLGGGIESIDVALVRGKHKEVLASLLVGLPDAADDVLVAARVARCGDNIAVLVFVLVLVVGRILLT